VFNGIAQLVVVSPHLASSTYAQGAATLAQLDVALREVGSSKESVLSVLVFLARMSEKQEFDRAWDEWATSGIAPMRACVGAVLTGTHLVELVVSAATSMTD
jgi:enamine deaminase RidA (YjgF/YER057c/UK114 family)